MRNTRYAKYLEVWNFKLPAEETDDVSAEMSSLKRVYINSYLHSEKCYTNVLLLLAVVKYTD